MKSIADDATGRTPTERRSGQRYVIEILSAGVLYAALVMASLRYVESFGGIVKYAVAVAPALGAAAMAIAMVRFALRMDELQRRTFVDAAAIAMVATAIITMAVGFLENAGLPRLSLTWVWPVAVVSWALALPFVRRRYC